MNPKLFVVGMLLLGTTLAADSSKILLMGKSVSADQARVSGDARVVVGDMSVSADAIGFDQRTNALTCAGAVSIRMGGNVVTAKDCVIQLDGEKKVFFLNSAGIDVQPGKPAEPSSSASVPAEQRKP